MHRKEIDSEKEIVHHGRYMAHSDLVILSGKIQKIENIML